jgi:large subunit ribosomal protein L1
VHAVVGKSSFDATKLVDNIRAFIDHIVGMQPSSVRGQYLKSISISGTMTPGVMVAG